MTSDVINKYIYNYIKNEKIRSAIMLSGPWGSGKSYYINNELIPHIEKTTTIKCIVVTVYGINDVRDISKNIFLEVKTKAMFNKNPTKTVFRKKTVITSGKVVAKTLFRGVTSFIGIDLEISQDDLYKMYSAIDISNNLIIIEDLERANISINEIMAYVYNLVNDDHAKVLVVANELEINEYNSIEKNDNNNFTRSSSYCRIKEKTISDTLYFEPNYRTIIVNIMRTFNSDYYNKLLNLDQEQSFISDMERIMISDNINSKNLRSIIYAFQKTNEIFENKTGLDIEFVKHILLSNVAFSLKRKKNDRITWIDSSSPSSLGTNEYPLYKFAYRYLTEHILDNDDLLLSNSDFLFKRNITIIDNRTSECLDTIYNYYIRTENEVYDAMKYITQQIQFSNIIPEKLYFRLLNYLIALKYNGIGADHVDKYKIAIKEKIRTSTTITKSDLMYHSGTTIDDKEGLLEFQQFKKEVIELLNFRSFNQSFTYDSQGVTNMTNLLIKNSEHQIVNSFINTLNVDKFFDYILYCTSLEVYNIRTLFQYLYNDIGSFENIAMHTEKLNEIRKKINQNMIDEKLPMDKIVKINIKYLLNDVNYYLEQMEKHTN